MKEKNEALNQLKQINGILSDSTKFVPFDGRVLIIWAVLGSVMLYFGPYIFKYSSVYGILFLLSGFFIGFIFEYFLVKNENEKFDLEQFTPIQKTIDFFYFIFSIFGILLTFLLYKANSEALIFPMWLFFIGMPGLIAGFLVHCNELKNFSILLIIISFLMFTYIGFNIHLINDIELSNILKITSIAIYSSTYIYLGLNINKKS